MSLATRLGSSQPALPLDVQHEFFYFIRVPRDRKLLKTCTLVCKDWETLLTPYLFHTFIAFGGSPRLVLDRLELMPTRVAHSFTHLEITRNSAFHMDQLLLILAFLLPNVHSVVLLMTDVTETFLDPSFVLPRKLSLRWLSLSLCEMLVSDCNGLISLLGHFDCVDSLILVVERPTLVPPRLPEEAASPSLPHVQHLTICDVDLSFLEWIVRQPRFAAEGLVTLEVAGQPQFRWEELMPLARILRAVKATLRCFIFKPSFGRNNFDGSMHGPVRELLADALSSCTSLRDVRLEMTCGTVGSSSFRHIPETFELYCLIIQKAAESRLPVLVDLKLLLTGPIVGDSDYMDAVVARIDWARLDGAAAGLVRRGLGDAGGGSLKPSLVLWFMPDWVDPRSSRRREVEGRFAKLDWRRLLPSLTDPADPRIYIRHSADQ